MKVKRVNRYYCEYCKKSGCSGGWMKKHEQHCTMNPNRVCGYCKLLNQLQPEMSDLLVILPNPKRYISEKENFGYISYRKTLTEKIEKVMPKLRELAKNCPACIMSALRQKGIPVPMVKSFDFKKECQAVWADFNEELRREDYQAELYSESY